MADDLIVVGAGGFGRETIDVVRAVNAAAAADVWRLVGVADDEPSDKDLAKLRRLRVQHLGSIDSVMGEMSQVQVAVAVGSPGARRSLVTKLERSGALFATLVHPTALVGSDVEMAEGAIICGGVSVGTGSRLDRHVHLNPHAVIGHDAALDSFVSVNPNSTVSGACRIGADCLIGAAAVVLQGLTVGPAAVVGAGAVVTKNVAAATTVKGVPAR